MAPTSVASPTRCCTTAIPIEVLPSIADVPANTGQCDGAEYGPDVAPGHRLVERREAFLLRAVTFSQQGKAGESDDRLLQVVAWRESDLFTDAERAALAMAEAATRLADHPEAVSDEIWSDAADHFDEQQLAAIILMIGITNLFNRLNTTIREPAGATWG